MLMSAVFAQSDCNQENWREYGKNLKDCQLQGVDFRGEPPKPTLREADFSGADLTGANLSINSGRLDERIDLSQADFRGAILTGVNLGGARMGIAKFDGVISGGIIGRPLYLTDCWDIVDGTLIMNGRNMLKNDWRKGLDNPCANWESIKNSMADGDDPSDMMADGDDPSDMMADGDDPSDMMTDGDDPSDMMADRKLSDELHSKIRGNKRRINLYQWNAWEKENDPQVSKGETTFITIDKNNDGKIGTGEFFQFYQRWIQD